MASLTGNSPGDTYKDLLQVSNSNSGIDGTLRPIEDGEGTEGGVLISTTGMRLKGTTTFDGLSGSELDFTNISVTSPKSWVLLAQTSPTSGTSFQVTGVPANATAVLIVYNDVSYSGNDRMFLQVLDAGTPETTGYYSTSVFFNSTPTASVGVRTSGLDLVRQSNTNGTNTHAGQALLVKNGTTGKWVMNALARFSDSSTPFNYMWSNTIGETPVVAGTMSGVEIETSSGSTFAAGTFSVYYSEQA